MKKIKLICLIEDDPIAALLSKNFIELTKRVEEIIIFDNGKIAYEGLLLRLNNGKSMPEIILLDINMPVWDGWEFYDEFKKLEASESVSFYILTSSLSPDDYEKAKYHGLDTKYISKPLNMNVLNKMFDETQ